METIEQKKEEELEGELISPTHRHLIFRDMKALAKYLMNCSAKDIQIKSGTEQGSGRLVYQLIWRV